MLDRMSETAVGTVDAEVVDLCRELIRMDTSNYGDDSGPGERKAAEYVASLLDEVGIESRLYESAPGRTSLVAHWGGSSASSGQSPLLLHGHLDVVPAAAEDWQVDPFAGEVRDGYLWGRGAVDMKDFDAMLLSVVRHRQRTGRVPERPIDTPAPSSWSSSTARSSKAAPKPSGRWADSAPRCAVSGST
jgi:acetylornithine deacetylase/succinyl-diaminopimelate desuccinylase-like protein